MTDIKTDFVSAGDRRQREYDEAYAEGAASRDWEVNHEWRWRLQTRRELDRIREHLNAIRAAVKHYNEVLSDFAWLLTPGQDGAEQQKKINAALNGVFSAIRYAPSNWDFIAESWLKLSGRDPVSIWESEGGALAREEEP